MPFEVQILEIEPPPAHQRIAGKVKLLRQLGMSRAAIARRLGADRKTVARTLAWLEEVGEARLKSGRPP